METIKEEKKAELEQLLNSLIEKGWKPRWHINYKICKYNDMLEKVSFNNKDYIWLWEHSLRELVSKESWLWQFVCENGMQKERPPYNRDSDTYWFTIQEYQYRLIESALKDESELTELLLNSISLHE